MSKKTIFPDNATPLEIAMEKTISQKLDEILTPFPSLWRPDLVTFAHMPWLASSLGVTEWDESADEFEKRETLKSNWGNQRQAGMRIAIQRAVEPLGVGVLIKPWYETKRNPYHFSIEIILGTKPLSPILLSRVMQRINDSKSERDFFDIDIFAISIAEQIGVPSTRVAAVFGDVVVAESLPYKSIFESLPD